MITFNWYPFSALTVYQLYAALALRSDIFVVEQACPYLDPDGKDVDALHLLGTEDDTLVTYMRLFPPTDTQDHLVFGRIVTARSARTKGYGRKIMQELINYCDANYPGIAIKCSAQHYLLKFYESFGFKAYGDVYDEDNIPHIAMKRERE